MNIVLRSQVSQPLEKVYQGFDERLFAYLLPPGAQLIAFGGSQKGDVVQLKLPLAGDWISEISEHGSNDDQHYFIDVGRTLPAPLKSWKHRHTLTRSGEHTVIEDNMTYSTENGVLDTLIYPFLYLAFLPRTWQYNKYFKN